MEKYKEYLIEDFKNEFEDFMVLIGIAVSDRGKEAEENKLSGFVAIEKLLAFYKSCKNIQDHILNNILEEKEETEEDRKVEADMPMIFKSSTKKLIEEKERVAGEKERYRLANLKEFEELGEYEQKEIMDRLNRYYEIDPERFNQEMSIISHRFGINMNKNKAIELINKKDLEEFDKTLKI